jgi:hypothetical protein
MAVPASVYTSCSAASPAICWSGHCEQENLVGSVKALDPVEALAKRSRKSEVGVAEAEIEAAGLGNYCSVL